MNVGSTHARVLPDLLPVHSEENPAYTFQEITPHTLGNNGRNGTYLTPVFSLDLHPRLIYGLKKQSFSPL